MKIVFKDRIKFWIVKLLLKTIALLPLYFIRSLGLVVGMVMLKISRRQTERLKKNLLRTNICNKDSVETMMVKTSQNLGMTLVETLSIAWQRSKKNNFKLCQENIGFDQVKLVSANGDPILFLTPHIGNFEIVLKSVAQVLNKKFTVLYKPDKNQWWNELMVAGRTEDNISPVPTTKKGVLATIRALKNQEFVGILPDSIASQGDGVWVDFFGNRVFATTLSAKLALMPGVKTFIVGAYRSKNGFAAEYISYTPTSDSVNNTVQEIYHVIEKIVEHAPEQFYWSYDRFRAPDHAPHDDYLNRIE